ncbi:helix-turn-helix transcriptional regulator [Allokutzneria albata]|uniref:helix-turn-helix transcriptional regulator n=1 Tax=Allokutzneria albata TaxID=211114 RepID=UPI0018D42901|nr:helix-turn-helix transcriptional regulator [Allokutzneria albata]
MLLRPGQVEGVVQQGLDLCGVFGLRLDSGEQADGAGRSGRPLPGGGRTTVPGRAFTIPGVLAQSDPTVAAFEGWVRERLAEPLSVGDAARAVGVSERTLQRTCRAPRTCRSR